MYVPLTCRRGIACHFLNRRILAENGEGNARMTRGATHFLVYSLQRNLVQGG